MTATGHDRREHPRICRRSRSRGNVIIDHRADIYAFGVMAYETLAGVPPFSGQHRRRQ